MLGDLLAIEFAKLYLRPPRTSYIQYMHRRKMMFSSTHKNWNAWINGWYFRRSGYVATRYWHYIEVLQLCFCMMACLKTTKPRRFPRSSEYMHLYHTHHTSHLNETLATIIIIIITNIKITSYLHWCLSSMIIRGYNWNFCSKLLKNSRTSSPWNMYVLNLNRCVILMKVRKNVFEEKCIPAPWTSGQISVAMSVKRFHMCMYPMLVSNGPAGGRRNHEISFSSFSSTCGPRIEVESYPSNSGAYLKTPPARALLQSITARHLTLGAFDQHSSISLGLRGAAVPQYKWVKL